MNNLESQQQITDSALTAVFKPRLTEMQKVTQDDDIFFESIGPDAWKDEKEVMNQIRDAMKAEDDEAVGRILREHSEAYLNAVVENKS